MSSPKDPREQAARMSFDADDTETEERNEGRSDQPLPAPELRQSQPRDAAGRHRARMSFDADDTETEERNEGRSDQPVLKRG